MFSHIIVPLDGTAESAVALPPARAMAQATGVFFCLLQVLHGHESREEVEASLKRIAGELAGSGVRVDVAVRQGEAAAQIRAEAADQDADLVVMSTHGRAGLGRVILGSVARKVLESTRTPVMLLRPGGHRLTQIHRLLVPVDGTPGGAIAIGQTDNQAQATNTENILYEAVEPIPAYAYDDLGLGYAGYVDPEWDKEALASAETYVQGLAERLKNDGLNVQGVARLGPITDSISAFATKQDVDLIIMSTHALTGPARAVLGSVADALVRSAHRPVLLVRRVPAGDELETPVLASSTAC